MYIEFWDVGAASPTHLPLTPGDIAAHLAMDWVPWVPTSASSSLMGWPSQLIETVRHNGGDVLALREELGRTERQWKGMLSWMLGVAGARHVLTQEGYRWIAPLSAYYPETVQAVNVATWPTAFPPSSITASHRSRSVARVRPDYIAVKAAGLNHAWTVAEAKGTSVSLATKSSCPKDWYDQVRNIVLCVNGSSEAISRYLVIATRVNPNAVNSRARRLQMRCWNTEDVDPKGLDSEAVVDVASAHLFGLFRNLRMPENARAVASSTQMRSDSHRQEVSEHLRQLSDIAALADNEIRNRFQLSGQSPLGQSPAVTSIDTNFGTVAFEFAAPLLDLVRSLRMAVNRNEAAEALQRAHARLDDWKLNQHVNLGDHNIVVLPFGIRVQLPPGFGVNG